MTTQPPDLKKLREVAERATPGPWEEYRPEHDGCTFGIDATNGDSVVMFGDGNNDGILLESDATFIATFNPQTILALLDAYEDKAERLCIVEQAFKTMQSKIDSLKDAYEASARDADRLRRALLKEITGKYKGKFSTVDDFLAARHATQGD